MSVPDKQLGHLSDWDVPAFPEVHTYGETVQEAAADAREAIELADEMYREEGRSLPDDPTAVVEVAP